MSQPEQAMRALGQSMRQHLLDVFTSYGMTLAEAKCQIKEAVGRIRVTNAAPRAVEYGREEVMPGHEITEMQAAVDNMSPCSNGGPAFPQYVTAGQITVVTDRGLSVRDYFAAKALDVLVAQYVNRNASEIGFKELAEKAYMLADAMIAERSK